MNRPTQAQLRVAGVGTEPGDLGHLGRLGDAAGPHQGNADKKCKQFIDIAKGTDMPRVRGPT